MKTQFERACLRWPGNKYSLLSKILPLVPNQYENYHEPFLGSATIFCNINLNRNSYLSDSNSELINFYQQVKHNLPQLISKISKKENSEVFFYSEREKKYLNPVSKAAQLYYLNRTCFNGIYRINSKGKFNVPYGRRNNFEIADKVNLKKLSLRLQTAELNNYDFFDSLQYINSNDFVYLDPPYSSKSRTNNFLMYNEKLFSWDDQIRLQEYCQILKKRKVKFVLNNLYNDEVFSLFTEKLRLKSIITERFSNVGAKMESRGMYKEYLFYSV